MRMDTIENGKVEQKSTDVNKKLGSMHNSFQSSYTPESDVNSEKQLNGTVDGLSISDAMIIGKAAIDCGKESLKDIKDFKEGNMTGGELAYELGENVAGAVGYSLSGIVFSEAEVGKETAIKLYGDSVKSIKTAAVFLDEKINLPKATVVEVK